MRLPALRRRLSLPQWQMEVDGKERLQLPRFYAVYGTGIFLREHNILRKRNPCRYQPRRIKGGGYFHPRWLAWSLLYCDGCGGERSASKAIPVSPKLYAGTKYTGAAISFPMVQYREIERYPLC